MKPESSRLSIATFGSRGWFVSIPGLNLKGLQRRSKKKFEFEYKKRFTDTTLASKREREKEKEKEKRDAP